MQDRTLPRKSKHYKGGDLELPQEIAQRRHDNFLRNHSDVVNRLAKLVPVINSLNAKAGKAVVLIGGKK